MKRDFASASDINRPRDLPGCPPGAHTLIIVVRVTAALVTIAAVGVIAQVFYALPWPADALMAGITATAWCRWLESRDPYFEIFADRPRTSR